jgi:hypothetical protein
VALPPDYDPDRERPYPLLRLLHGGGGSRDFLGTWAAATQDLAVLIEVGTEDGLELHRGAEFLHRVLWDGGLKHEYRLVLGADHMGRGLVERFRYAFSFIGSQWNPGPVDEDVAQFRRVVAPMRRQAGLE